VASLGAENFSLVINSLAGAGAVYVAWLGVSTWKTQIRWQQGRGLAARLLQSFGAVFTAFRNIRAFDYPGNMKQIRESDRQKNFDDLSHAVLKELEHLETAICKFEYEAAEAWVVWEKSFEPFAHEIREIQRDFRVAWDMGLRSVNPEVIEHQREQIALMARDLCMELYGHDLKSKGALGKMNDLKARLELEIQKLRLS
jgi:hypothetical protein